MILCFLKWILHQKSHFHLTKRIPESSLLPLLLCHKRSYNGIAEALKALKMHFWVPSVLSTIESRAEKSERRKKAEKGGKRREKAEKADLVMQLAFWQTLQQLESSCWSVRHCFLTSSSASRSTPLTSSTARQSAGWVYSSRTWSKGQRVGSSKKPPKNIIF